MDKIEEIRQKPEHERIRYVWGMVSVSMIFIVFIWLFSFKSMFRGEDRINSGSDTVIEMEKNNLEMSPDRIENGIKEEAAKETLQESEKESNL